LNDEPAVPAGALASGEQAVVVINNRLTATLEKEIIRLVYGWLRCYVTKGYI
jgi:hypothetical protein